MKGIIFNILEDVVVAEHGEAVWDVLLDVAQSEGVWTALGNYDDAEIGRLVRAAAAALDVSPDTVLRWFGRAAIPRLAERYPEFFEPHAETHAFLLTLNDVIHREVVKLYPGARTPRFGFEEPGGRVLMVEYVSARQMCALAEGMIEGAADHYGERVAVEHVECLARGGARCLMSVDFGAGG